MKIYVINDCDYVAANSVAEAEDVWNRNVYGDLDEGTRELTDEELDRMKFVISETGQFWSVLASDLEAIPVPAVPKASVVDDLVKLKTAGYHIAEILAMREAGLI